MRRRLSAALLTLLGWKRQVEDPVPDRAVIIAAPHTSNWDFFLLLLFAWSFDVRLSFVGKHTLFMGPMGPIMRMFGGIPVDRSKPGGLVGQLSNEIAEAARIGLVIPAEGSRSRRDYWKSGFYRIAEVSGVPISLSFLDYERKLGGFGPCFSPSGDLKRDMDRIRAFYADKKGLNPELFGPIRLREEEGAKVEDESA